MDELKEKEGTIIVLQAMAKRNKEISWLGCGRVGKGEDGKYSEDRSLDQCDLASRRLEVKDYKDKIIRQRERAIDLVGTR